MKNPIKNIIILLLLFSVLWACKKEDPVELVNFTDQNLFSVLLEQGIDTDKDGFISVEEAQSVKKITIVASRISDFSDLKAFSNLDSLVLKMVSLEYLDLSVISELRYLDCNLCDFTHVDLSGNFNLEEIICEKNQIESLKLPPGQVLQSLRCSYNRLRELDVSKNPALVSLHCDNNFITQLDLSNNLQLTRMISCVNQLTSLDVSKNKSITVLGVGSMPMLTEVFVWTLPFPPEGVKVIMPNSTRINFMLKE